MAEDIKQLRRILLPLDVSADSLSALEAAFDLAAALGAEVSGLFIEDASLLIAGRLPFAREIGSRSGIPRRIGSADIELALKAVAGKAREALSRAGDRLKVSSSFRVTRGDVPGEILTAATDADLVVLGKAGWSVGSFRKPGGTCLSILSRSTTPVLIVERGTSLSAPILAVDDGTPAGRRALVLARTLGNSLGWNTAVYTVGEKIPGDGILQKVRESRPRVVVLPTSVLSSEYASKLECPVIFVP